MGMAKKKKNNEQLPEGMSRRQAKLAARAAGARCPRKGSPPFGGLAAEASLVAMQEFVPSATAKLSLKGFDKDVYVSTVLPGASAALIRDEEFGGEAFVGLQVQSHTHNPGRDLAYALNWVKNNKPGSTLESTAADGTEPALSELLEESAELISTSTRTSLGGCLRARRSPRRWRSPCRWPTIPSLSPTRWATTLRASHSG